jgi:hypothetical protein
MDDSNKIKMPKDGFIKHVFDFGDDSKSEVINSIQYLGISFLPVLLANHAMNKIFSEIGTGNNKIKAEDASSVQLLAEVLSQLSISLVLLFFINKFVTYFPTYSGTPFTELNMVNLVFMLLPMPIESGGNNVGKKLQVLIKRFDDVIFGDAQPIKKTNAGQKSNVRVSQPISGQIPRSQPTHQASRADYVDHHQKQQPVQEPKLGSSNAIYGGPTNNLIDADFGGNPGQEGFNNMPVQAAMSEPAAANGVLGGSFGSAF